MFIQLSSYSYIFNELFIQISKYTCSSVRKIIRTKTFLMFQSELHLPFHCVYMCLVTCTFECTYPNMSSEFFQPCLFSQKNDAFFAAQNHKTIYSYLRKIKSVFWKCTAFHSHTSIDIIWHCCHQITTCFGRYFGP